MKSIKIVFAAVVMLGLAACSMGPFAPPQTVAPVDVTQLAPMRVASVDVSVPETLTVSEDNSYDPKADIVWRGDPFGPRYPQVKAVVEAGIQAGTKDLDGNVPVDLVVVVQRFHSQTQKVRYSFGGKYEIYYDLEVRDARSGEVIIPSYTVYAIADAPGGDDALVADQEGRTEKDDNIALMADSIRAQLTGTVVAPAG